MLLSGRSPAVYKMRPLASSKSYAMLDDESSTETLVTQPPISSLGKPEKRNRVYLMDLATLTLSFACLAASVAVVARDDIAWMLSDVNNGQLVVLGFLLSVMNLCLASITPRLFLLLEARFGMSTLQNYDGLLRNNIFGSQLDTRWRLVLFIMMALPLGLSAGYKQFTGGESVRHIPSVSDYIGNISKLATYGMYSVPVSYRGTGIALFSNATQPFYDSTADIFDARSQRNLEPAAPANTGTGRGWLRPYGYNTLLLSNTSTAMLDIPHPNYLAALQGSLSLTESWKLSASVYGTVAAYNTTKDTHPAEWDAEFENLCKVLRSKTGAYNLLTMFNGYLVFLMDYVWGRDNTRQYLALPPSISSPNCSYLAQYVQEYDVTRRACTANWTITRGGMKLDGGSCSETPLDDTMQAPITNNTLAPGFWYMPTMVDFLGAFASSRNGSAWSGAYYSTFTAAMLWSRIVRLDSKANDLREGDQYRYAQKGIEYVSGDTVYFAKPTLQKSIWLYAILVIQPAALLATIVALACLADTPISRGFNLVAIMAGLNDDTVHRLAGASFSGNLRSKVRLAIRPVQNSGQTGQIQYSIMPVSSGTDIPRGNVASGVKYS